MSTLTFLTNLKGSKGDKGDPGAQGLPGTGAVPADSAVAGYVSTAGSSATQTALDKRFKTGINAAANGVVGDGTTDDSAALAALLAAAASFGRAPVDLAPGSTVLCGSTVAVPSGARIRGNGALIKKSAALAGVLFNINNASNLVFESFRVDGQKALFAASEFQHGFYIVNGSTDVTIRDVQVTGCNGDGIYVGDQTAASSGITLDNVSSTGNSRQGMSVSHVSGLEATNCLFAGSSGKNPQAGVDIEPNSAAVVCENIKFTNCVFSGNGHFGFLVAFANTPTAHQGGVELVGCTIIGNGVAADTFGGGLNLRGAVDFTMTGGSIRGNTGPGVLIDYTLPSTGVKLNGVIIQNNTTHGVLVTQAAPNLCITGCTITGNGTSSGTTYDGIMLAPSAAMVAPRLIGNVVSGSSQRYGLNTSSNVSGLVSIGNDYSGNGTASTSLGDEQVSRTQMDGASGVSISSRQFFYSTAAATIQSFRLTGDSGDRLALLTDGRLLFGPGNASTDAQLSRVAAGVVGTGAGQAFRPGVAVTGSRPAAATVGKGSMFYDSTLSKPIWSDGTAWRDAGGTAV